MKTKAV